jgi:hypothetical protein
MIRETCRPQTTSNNSAVLPVPWHAGLDVHSYWETYSEESCHLDLGGCQSVWPASRPLLCRTRLGTVGLRRTQTSNSAYGVEAVFRVIWYKSTLVCQGLSHVLHHSPAAAPVSSMFVVKHCK